VSIVNFLLDVAIGFCALIAVFVLSLFTGGFSFFTPWIIWGMILLSVAGFSRSTSQGESVWQRVISINVCWLIALAAMLRGTWWGAILCAVGTFVPTTAGVTARRALTRARN
jgi:hypothetical protein